MSHNVEVLNLITSLQVERWYREGPGYN